jgi:hypothetical protein
MDYWRVFIAPISRKYDKDSALGPAMRPPSKGAGSRPSLQAPGDRATKFGTALKILSEFDADAYHRRARALPLRPIRISWTDDSGATEHGHDGNSIWSVVPALSVPSGITAGGLPTGLQIVGRRHCD